MKDAQVHALFDELSKIGGLGADLRMKGIGGVTRPPEPTEDSKNNAFSSLKNSQSVGAFHNVAKPKNLIKPGPTIQQVAPTPQPV
jgi:hypothetical protein